MVADGTTARLPDVTPAQRITTWVRTNLFSTWYNTVITIVLLYGLANALVGLAGWMAQAQGWPAAFTNMKLILAWTYPNDQIWRPQLAVLIVAALLGLSAGVWRGVVQLVTVGAALTTGVLAVPAVGLPEFAGTVGLPSWLVLAMSVALLLLGIPLGRRAGGWLRWVLIVLWIAIYPIIILIVRGGIGLPVVETKLWGGLMLTLLLAISGIVLSFPIGVALALGRRSRLPVIRIFCVAYIELIRGVPLVTVLYMGSLLLPLFLPGGESVDQFIRAMVAVTLFSAAYLAENVRGGLQALPAGQTEAARALGLNVVQTTFLITLPQALRAIVPLLVGQSIGLFKDTSLVVIVGLIDLLGAAQNVVGQPDWLGTPGGVWRETFLVIAAIYWIFSFTMSRVSKRIEDSFATSRH
jgi:general L-amino acid transport system permease protein